MADIKKTFGLRVRNLRKSLGMSQEKLAEKCGLHRTYIGIVERWEKNLTLENIEKMAHALWINIKDLF